MIPVFRVLTRGNEFGSTGVPLGSELTLTPTATSGCFYQWGGDLTGSSSPGALTVAGAHAVTAEFAMRSPFALSVIGEASITLDPPQPPEGYWYGYGGDGDRGAGRELGLYALGRGPRESGV